MSNKVFSGDFLKVLLALKESIMKDIHCSELAVIKEVYDNNCNCSLLSNPEIKINAYKTKGTICRVGDIVLVAFSDNDFRSNLVKNNNKSKLQVIDSPIKHQLDYGVIVSNLTIGIIEDKTKANVDASNLTEENVTSWQTKCNFERTELIYDADSLDSNLNWGYRSGISQERNDKNGITILGKSFEKYKRVIVYISENTFDDTTAEWGSTCQLVVDLTKPIFANSSIYRGFLINSSSYVPYYATNEKLTLSRYYITIDKQNNSFNYSVNDSFATDFGEDAFHYRVHPIYKMEGVLY